MDDIVLIGCGGHAKAIVDSIEVSREFHIVGMVEKKEVLSNNYRNYKTIGSDRDLEYIFKQGIKNAFISIGFLGGSNLRNKIYLELKTIGFNIPVIIDKTAIIASDVLVDEGVYIGKGAIINSNAQIKKMSIINTRAIIEHDSIIGEFSHVASGSVVCGGVLIGKNVFIGANTTVIHSVKINDNVIIGAGGVVNHNLGKNVRVCGVPVREIPSVELI